MSNLVAALRKLRPVPLVLASLLPGSCGPPSAGTARADGVSSDQDMLKAVCTYEDGLRLALGEDASDGSWCAGANVVWIGDDLQFSLVRVAAGQTAPVSHPSYVHPKGGRFIFIPLEHVKPGTWVHWMVDVRDPAGGVIREKHGLRWDRQAVACDVHASDAAGH